MNRRTPQIFRRRTGRAFTLVEMFIVGVLIALFSSLAIFGVQQQYRSNQRKAIIGETRQLAQAMDFAYDDIGVFPKICFLPKSKIVLELDGQQAFGGNGKQIYLFSHALGLDPTLTDPFFNRLEESWSGPYFAISSSRNNISQGRGGSITMFLPDMETGGAGVPGVSDVTSAVFTWPTDTFNNPYMFYMLNVDRTDPNAPTLAFVTEDLSGTDELSTVPTATGTGNFINAIVSYGPNQVPGGGENFAVEGSPFDNTGHWAFRIYSGNPNVSPVDFGAPGSAEWRSKQPTLLTDTLLNRARANVWSQQYYFNQFGNTTDMPRSDDALNAVGIVDPGSDDVVYEF